MQTASDRAASFWIRPEFARLLAILWVVGLALIYLIRYGGWVLPFQLVDMISVSLPGLHVGAYFREFWSARLYDFGCVLVIVAAALGLGATLMDSLIARRDVFGTLLAMAVGLWLLAVLVLVIGAVSVTKVPYVFLTLACWFSPAPRKFVLDFHISSERTDGWAKFMMACLVLAAILNLAGALAPPFEYDELEYHLGALADYQRVGHIAFLPHNFYSNMPQLTEMLYLLAKVTTSDIAAKLLHWAFGVLTALAVYGLAQRLWSKAFGLTAAALFYCAPFVQDLSQTARIDLATAFFTTLAFGAVVLWMEEDERELLWLSGLCAGAAVATKWPAIPVVLLPACVLVVLRRKPVVLITFGLLAGIMVVPWLVKNWWLTGNPLYPMFNSWLPNSHWSAAQAAVLSGRHSPTFGMDGMKQFLGLLWDYSFIEAGAVPLLLMTVPLMWLIPRIESSAKRLGWLFVAAYVAWFCATFRPWRFLFPAFGVAAVAAAYAMDKVGRDTAVRIAVRLAVGIVLLASVATLALDDLADVENPQHVPPQISLMRYDLGQFTGDEFVARIGQGVMEPIVWMNQHLPADAKVLYVGEARAYYARQPIVYGTAFDGNPLTAMSRAAKTPEELRAALRAQGITHIYLNTAELSRLQRGYDYMAGANWQLIGDMLQEDAHAIHTSGRRTVYELEK